MEKVKLYIVGPNNGGGGIYSLIHENGTGLASHMCSSVFYARDDLEAGRPERQENWKKEFGEYKILFLGDDEMTESELIERNRQIQRRQKNASENTNKYILYERKIPKTINQ